MGIGFSFNCKKCGEKAIFYLGTGRHDFGDPKASLKKSVEKRIREGMYGDKFRMHLEKYPKSLIDVSRRILSCNCGYIWNELSFSLETLGEIASSEECSSLYCPYIGLFSETCYETRTELDLKYRLGHGPQGDPALIYRSEPVCKKCTSFTSLTEFYFPQWMYCPKCKTRLVASFFLWD